MNCLCSLAPMGGWQVWAGDNDASFSPANGMPTVVKAGLSAAMSGIFIWGHDVGGYLGAHRFHLLPGGLDGTDSKGKGRDSYYTNWEASKVRVDGFRGNPRKEIQKTRVADSKGERTGEQVTKYAS